MVLQAAGGRQGLGVAGDVSGEDLPGPAGGAGEDGVEDSVVGGLSPGVDVDVRSCVNSTYLGQSLAGTSCCQSVKCKYRVASWADLKWSQWRR